MSSGFRFALTILYLAYTSFAQESNSFNCISAISNYHSDSELLKVFTDQASDFISNSANNHSGCIDSLLRTGNYDTAVYYMEQLSKNKIQFRDSLRSTVSQIEREMKDLYNKYRFEEEEFQKVTPVLQWAQSLNNIFLEIKFSHRHDSPGCPEVKNLNIDLTSKELYLTSYCIQADVPIKFELKLPFFVEINREESKHDHASNGRYIFNMPKSKGGMFWDRLVRETSDYPRHTKLWLDMHEKYKSEIEKFMNDDEEEEYQKLLEDLNKKKKKGRKKKVKFN